MTRQQILFIASGVVLLLAFLVAGGVWDPTAEELTAGSLGLLGASLFVFGHA